MKSLLLVLAVLVGGCASTPPRIPVLIVDGQNNHEWETTTKVLREALESADRFVVDVATSPRAGASLEGFEPPFHSHRAVVLNYNGAAWPARTRNAFIEYVRNGGGVVVVHAANNAFPDWPEYNEMIGLGGWGRRDERSGPYLVLKGNEWKRDLSPGIGGAHGPQYAFPVRVRAPNHPITRGMPTEWLHVQDELYARLRGPALNLTVLATAWSDPGKRGSGRHEPVMFTVDFGRGRVFHTALGHADYSMRCTGFITALQRGAEWAATGRVTLPIPADFPTSRRTRGRGDTSFASTVRPPMPAWPKLPSPDPVPREADAGERAGAERSFALGMRFCWCPQGSFLMGSQVHEELFQGDEKARVVTFPRGFWLAKHEVTRAEWREAMETTPWARAAAANDPKPVPQKDADAWPATHVTWDDALTFCRRITKRERQAGRLPQGWVYRLPTEAEWEYGCRAGSPARWSFGDREADLTDHAWFAGNTVDEGRNHPQPVGRKRPNAWGLCDMHGNVWEWCLDTYESKKAFRGGCWGNIAWWCRSADRNATPAASANDMLGFRILLARPAAGYSEDSEIPIAQAPFDARQAKAYQTQWARRRGTTVESTNSLGTTMVLIPPGEFLMGSSDKQVEAALQVAVELEIDQRTQDRIRTQERPQHTMRIAQPFLLAATEVTIAQFRKFVEATDYVTEAEVLGTGNSATPTKAALKDQNEFTWRTPGFPQQENAAVSQVSWNDAVVFCNWLSRQEQLTPCYRKDAEDGWTLIPENNGYRLPSEAQWEFACRAGTTGQYHFGDDYRLLEKYDWYGRIGKNATRTVGTKLPNAFGLYNMHGNVGEWCQDFYDPNFYQTPRSNDPTGPAKRLSPKSRRVIRGGDWWTTAVRCRSTFRGYGDQVTRSDDLGFRLMRSLQVPSARH